jgi:hypothetical protein
LTLDTVLTEFDDAINPNDTQFSLEFSNEFKIFDIIEKFQSINNLSWDGISTRDLFIAAPLCHLVYKSFSQGGAFPDNLKT